MPPSPKESLEQETLATWLTEHFGRFWFHTPNGGHRFKAVADKLRRQGVKPGIPDAQINVPFRYKGRKYAGCFVELKRQGGGQLRHTQRIQLGAVALAGYFTFKANGAEAAIDMLIGLYGEQPELPQREVTACWHCMIQLKPKQRATPRKCLTRKNTICRSKAFTFSSLEQLEERIELGRRPGKKIDAPKKREESKPARADEVAVPAALLRGSK